MNATPTNDPPSLRAVRHNHLRRTSLATVIVAALGFPVTLALFSLATVSCMGGFGGTGWCETINSLPLLALAIAIAAYAFVFWIIHELGHQSLQTKLGAAPESRYAWQHAKLGYKELDQGHHRLVRRVHRVSSIVIAELAAYVSFQFFETDTLANLAVAAIAFAICEILNWKTYPTLMKEDEQLRAKVGS